MILFLQVVMHPPPPGKNNNKRVNLHNWAVGGGGIASYQGLENKIQIQGKRWRTWESAHGLGLDTFI